MNAAAKITIEAIHNVIPNPNLAARRCDIVINSNILEGIVGYAFDDIVTDSVIGCTGLPDEYAGITIAGYG